ncbi:Cellulose biosynthesis protein BcsQ [Quadrisphaera granulorum]|uniref:Cellulose biosynthesis protein BcsQ n=1 Tax=Quadrisphaera granulorum TaxID=317664 RepID=A0A316AA91_9ACTN|nr:ParA family protein [Quadrisphaera granulorum]PWJ54826.1 cellulose biosynthesis protein BcsQ [Quadrisphaera granulorum]SZE95772.1 Cellulose biosynthesis protein BcsQ [Quadrisphaera granulorum]
MSAAPRRSGVSPLPLLTAVPGPEEAQLVAALGRVPGVVVVRRCADLGELLSASAAGHGRAALLSADLHRLDRDALARLAVSGTAVVGVLPAVGAASAAARLQAMGVSHVVSAGATGVEVAAVVTAAVTEAASGVHDDGSAAGGRVPSPTPVPSVERAPLSAPSASPQDPRLDRDDDDEDDDGGTVPLDPARRAGRLLAVWGAPGAPGRTTVAVSVAAELAALGEHVLLVDADTWAASTAQALGLLDESAGIAAACRAAAAGTLTPGRLLQLAPAASPRLSVLTGLPRADRWHELGAAALEELWSTCRTAATWTVIDCAAPLEQDEELVLDTAAPRRNAATTTALTCADEMLVVGQADPVGLQRLVRALADLAEALPELAGPPRAVVTKVRSSAVGQGPSARVAEALARYAGVRDAVLVPDDRAACDLALLTGRTLRECAPGSAARTALAGLARELATRALEADGEGTPAPVRTRRRRWVRMRG